MARIRTLSFLPEIFQTPTNSEFLAATLDQLVNPPTTTKIQGFIGSKLGYGVNANDAYVPEPDKTRTDYQLEPGVVFEKTNTSTAKDFITYPGMLDSLKLQYGTTKDNNKLFTSDFYSWDSFCNLDKLVNYNQYYWLPEGPPAVNVAPSTVYTNVDYVVTSNPNSYDIRVLGAGSGSSNPTITLLRGGSYNFYVNQDSQFYIQGEPGVTGYSPLQPNLYTRDVYGVENNGASSGVVTFNVPQTDAQDEYVFPGNNIVDVVSDKPFSEVNGQLLSTVGDIDGITELNGLRVMFYDTGVLDEYGYTSSYYSESPYDTNNVELSPYISTTTLDIQSTNSSGNYVTLAAGHTTSELYVNQTIVFNNPTVGNIDAGQVYYVNNILNSTDFTISLTLGGSDVTLTSSSTMMTATIGEGLYEEGFYTQVNATFYRITYLGNGPDYELRLIPDGTIPTEEKITPTLGTQYNNLGFYRNILGYIQMIPYISAPLSTLYYQDSVESNRVGVIRLIDSNITNTLDVDIEILGHKNYTSANGVVFTNGLKVRFSGDVIPSSYLQGEYYVEGVGTAIELVPVSDLVCPEKFSQGIYNPYDVLPYDNGNYEINLYIPILQDYITIARNALNRNAWSRSNRWFHIDVINATAQYNNNPGIKNLANNETKAKRPIIEFYPNLRMYDSGVVGKKPIDFIDTRNTNALATVPDSLVYYPDIQVYSNAAATISAAVLATSTTVVVPVNDVYGSVEEYMYINDSSNILPNGSQITNIANDGVNYTFTVSWTTAQNISLTNDVSIYASATTTDNYSLFNGARVVFANDDDINVRNKIYVAEYSVVTDGDVPVLTLTLAEDGNVDLDTQLIVYRGYYNQGNSFYFNGSSYEAAQQKNTVNQPPLFDIFDRNGISLGDSTIYEGTSFKGTKLFSYKIGTGTADSVLGFSVAYTAANNVGDINFDVSLNSDKFTYVVNGNPVTQNINVGYVYNYTSGDGNVRQLGYQNTVAPSVQYQVFNFEYDINNPVTYLECDIAALPDLAHNEKGWPRVKVYYNNVYQSGGHTSGTVSDVDFTYTIGANKTTITLVNPPTTSTPIEVLVLSDQVSEVAYYQIPINLSNNPTNIDLTLLNLSDVRYHYESIFDNAPQTTGVVFGANNYRDCGNIVPYGTQLIQNSASLALPGMFLRTPYHNIFDALMYNSREYIKYKQLIVYTVENTSFDQTFRPSAVLDNALNQITASRSEVNSFFWSDMLPNKSPYISNTYTFNNGLDNTYFPLSKVYDFSSANYDGVIVYLIRGNYEYQLLRGFDYIVSTDSPSLNVTTDLLPGDLIVINEYNQTYGSYVPYTPTKLGLYPAFEPAVVLDSDYMVPTYFIRGHDGSFTKLYGHYDAVNGVLIDFRDQALLEFEQRIYNNIKLSTIVPIRDYEVLPGYFRQSTATYSWKDFLAMYTPNFLDWIGQNRLDYKTQYFSKNAPFTYNYSKSGNKLSKTPILQGYWRGAYSYFYDSVSPNLTPWEMLGFTIMPDWWTARYGPAPYTSGNKILWNDIEKGYIYNNGDGYYVPELARPNLSKILPVDSAGNLVSPFTSLVGNYVASTFQADWKVGDMGPVELSYRRSSTWPFDLMRLFALTRPAEFFNLGVDLDNYKYSTEFNQYLVNNRSYLNLDNIQVYGDGVAKTSYINWIVDFEKQQGIDATTNITDMLQNTDVRLVYRLAGYSDKNLLNFYIEKANQTATNSTLLIPQESYSILLYENQPYNKIVFSGVVVQQNQGYYTVYGNSQNYAYFEVSDPIYDGKYEILSVEKSTVKVAKTYSDNKTLVPYGTKFYSNQDLAQFLMSYGYNLQSKGVVFDNVVNGITVNWEQMVLEFLYWSQQGWENGSIISLNPSAQDLTINTTDTVVQPLTLTQQNFILNQNLYPVNLQDICVTRDGTIFHVHTLNTGDAMSYAQFNMSNFEHGIVFDNITQFNDVVYNLVTGLRQNRIYVRGTKSAEWNGTINALGFILSQDDIKEYDNTIRYAKGMIVKYKNRYYTALLTVQPSPVFDETKWKTVNYDNLRFGMLANPSTRAYESSLYYNVYEANLQNDADLLAYSLIGYRPRDYLANLELTSTAQVEIYKNLIRNKGTNNSIEAFKGANLPQGGIQYDTHENWAIQINTYGGVNNQNFVDFRVNQALMTGDPSIVSLINGNPVTGSMENVNIYDLYNYGTNITNENILKTTASTDKSIYPSAGYVNYDDVKMAAYYYAQLPNAVDTFNNIIPIQNFYVGEYMWLANFKQKWNVFRWKTLGQIIQVNGNSNRTATITFNKEHNLKKNDPLAIVNFANNVDGYYLVNDVVNLYQVIVDLSLVGSNNVTLQGNGLGFGFESQRVNTPGEIATLNLIENEFVKNTVWVDTDNNGSWAVYRKNINYLPQSQLESDNYTTYGSSVAYTPTAGYMVGDATQGEVYRYSYDQNAQTYNLVETITDSTSFGSSIAYYNNVFAISKPDNSGYVKLYVLNSTVLTDQLLETQTINNLDGSTNWGNDLAFSDDGNWLYISALDLDSVYVYQKQNIDLVAGYFNAGETYIITSLGDTDFTMIGAVDNQIGITFVATGIGAGTGTATQISYQHVNTISGSSGDLFGTSISTNVYGDRLIVGTPGVDYSYSIQNNGAAYVYARTVQNYEAPYNSVSYQPISCTLAWTPNNISSKSGSAVSSDAITLNNVTNLSVDMPIMFIGTNNSYNDFKNSGINPYTVYYIHSIVGSTIKVKTSRNTSSYVSFTNASGLAFDAYPQNNPMYVSVNGDVVQDNNYAVANNNFYYLGNAKAGDIINISDNGFYLLQELNSDYTDRTDIQYGTSVDTNNYGSNIVVGSPYEIDSDNVEGAVYSYVDGGAKYGVVLGKNECNVTTDRIVLINGYLVPLYAGNATSVAEQINSYKVINVQAQATIDNKLILQLIDNDLGPVEQKLLITAFSSDVLSELGLEVFTNTQIIKCPHGVGPSAFGTTIKINENNNIIVSAPVGTRYEGTFFDFSDDERLTNDTLFDNNATRFVESYPNAGAVYMFDYLANYQESLDNPGQYVYAQSVNDNSTDYGYDPGYGLSLDFNGNIVMVGCPNYQPVTVGGKVVVYNNSTGIDDWSVYRQSCAVVDINSIQNSQLFSASTNETLINLDYFDPLQNKLLGPVRENIDFVTGVDPANYNVNYTQQSGMIWGAAQVGMIWFDTTNVRWLNYHQDDVVYNSRHWGSVFPGSDVAVYTWISSYVLPVNYQGPGTPYDVNQYVVNSILNSSGVITPIYYYWVRDVNAIVDQYKKTLSDTTIASYINNPSASGISYMAPLLPNTFAMYNSTSYFNGVDTVFHIGFSTGSGTDVIHNEYKLIRENYSEDFLPGLPVEADNIYTEPTSLYAKLLDSLSGCDTNGQVVPNPYLPLAVQQGIQNYPRQSFFYDRFGALENYVNYINELFSQYPIVEIAELTYLFEVGPINPSNGKPFYDVTDFWEYANYWVPGYNNNTKPVAQVLQYANLVELTLPAGSIVKVIANENGYSEYYINNANQVWERIGVENGTIQIKSSLYDYTINRYGFGDNYFDTTPYDEYPSTETRYIVRAFNEQLPGEFDIFRNQALILLFRYIQSETIESQNYLPWLNKTSLVDVTHNLRELLPYTNYVTDNTAFLSEYLNEVKPYHVVLKDFLYKYSKTDAYLNHVTDFDVPATYNSRAKKYISPQMVYSQYSNSVYQYTYDNNIWQTAPYTDWYNNYGLSFGTPEYNDGVLTGYVGQTDYNLTSLVSYINLNTKSFVVDNSNGWPVNGVIQIDDEQIAYDHVDYLNNIISGVFRGYNNTPIQTHIPSTPIYINLPAILLLNGGRGYANPPKITAKIDTSVYPAPRTEAVFQAVMSLDTVSQITVLDPGLGYAALPEIDIEPSSVITFDNTSIVGAFNTLVLYSPDLQTGDLIRYKNGTGAGVGGLVNNEWYYINVLERSPNTIIAFYRTYIDAVNDAHRVDINDIGTSTGMTINLGARAVAITKAAPTREAKVNIKFDRTSYQSQIVDWQSNAFYGAFYAGNYYTADSLSSNSLSLDSTNPDINTLLASAHGVAFEIADVTTEQQYVYSSFIRQVKQTFAANNAIRLIPLDGNNPDLSELEPNASGTTIGMYTNMPVKFNGSAIGGIVEDQTYYVKDILNELDFTISDTINGTTFILSDDTVTTPLSCITGNIDELSVLTVNYPNILTATNTTMTTNAVTIPVTAIGTGGTNNFYPGMLLYFTANNEGETMFGNIVDNQVYYVNTIIDEQNFTISMIDVNVATNINDNPFTTNEVTTIYSTTATDTNNSGNVITVDSTADFAVNDPVIFNNMVISGVSVTDFGNIISGQLYYVSSIINDTTMTISEAINGDVFVIATVSGTMTVTNQKNTVKLSTASGTMTAIIGLPVSPGQVNGQQFVVYPTSSQYSNIGPGDYTISDLLSVSVTAAISTVDRLAVSDTNNFYENMPFQLQSIIGGLSASTTYYVKEYTGMPDMMNPGQYLGNISVVCDSTSSTGNKIHTAMGYDTTSLYVNMPITFSGNGIGGIIIGLTYYVESIVDGTHFTVSESVGGSAFVLMNDSGTMTGTGVPYITVSATAGGPAISLSDDVPVSPVILDQTILADPTFDVSYILGGYRVLFQDPGEGFAISNTIKIKGTLVGGTSPTNDLTMTVNTVDDVGAITSVIAAGTPAGSDKKYYFKIRGSNKFEVYMDPLLKIPATSTDFPYVGFTETTATDVTASNNRITVDDTSAFNLYDPVVFSGDVFSDDIVVGQTYYVKNIVSPTQLTISYTVNGTTVDILSDASGSMTMAKAGSFAFLSEPFYFTPSIIRFNGRLYKCVVSNNDKEFVIGKWELIDSGDYRINALDRAVGYYQPTSNMPGRDLTQLFDGLTYPNATYYGNAFEPAKQFPIDTIVQDQPFYPTGINLSSIAYNNGYIASANTTDNSLVATSTNGNSWNTRILTPNNVNFSDIIYANGLYVMTSTSKVTPVYLSMDKITWTATTINTAGLVLNAITYYNNGYIAGGNNIVRSTDGFTWTRVRTFPTNRNYEVFDLQVVAATSFNGVVAVGQASEVVLIGDVYQLMPINLVCYSVDGINFNQANTVSSNSFRAVTSDGSNIVAGGQNGVLYTSINGSDWYGINEGSVVSFNSTNNIIETSNMSLQLDQEIQFSESFSTIVAGTTYYVKSIISPALITISDTVGGSTKVLTADLLPAGTMVYGSSYDGNDINSLAYGNGTYISVGNDGVIKTSTDAHVWTTQTSNTTENLNKIIYIDSDSSFVVVGDNNTIISTVDNGVTWTNISLFNTAVADNTIRGADFQYGYGPEELVPGLVKDNLSMTVTTRPGVNWPVTTYGHSGYITVSLELQPTMSNQTEYYFGDATQYPAQVFVQLLDTTTLLGTTLYEGIDYTVNWQSKLVVLNNPLSTVPLETLRIDVYEAGNGNQLVRSNTDADPIRTNQTTGFNEIYVDCNFSATIYQGSGIVKPGTFDSSILAIETESGSNRITVETVKPLVLGAPITFSGALFGGLTVNTTYFVKSISTATNSITVSLTYDPMTGVAGPTVALTDGTGSMNLNLSVGSEITYTNELIYNNGSRLLQGHTSQITSTSSVNNAITTNSTAGILVDDRITFSASAFGNIQPLTTYYVKQVIDTFTFTISASQGGPEVVLSDATGGATYITNDYAFGIQPDGVSAKIIFATDAYTNASNYITYTLLGETEPVQIGYTIPETQLFLGDGMTQVFTLSNYVGQNNPENSVVEINGLRVDPADYTIDFNTNTITFVVAPNNNDNISVTSYNYTDQEYFHTQVSTTNEVYAINYINNDIQAPTCYTIATATTALVDTISVATTNGMSVGQRVEFHGTSFGGVATDGTVYYIYSVDTINSEIQIVDYNNNLVTLSTDTGSMTVTVGGLPAVLVDTTMSTTYTTNTEVRIDGVVGPTQLNNNIYYIRVVTPTSFELYTQPYDSALNSTNYPVTNISSYISGGYVWEKGSIQLTTGVVTATSSSGNLVTIDSTSDLVEDTVIYFSEPSSNNGDMLIGNIQQGVPYYIKAITSNIHFTISETQGGDEFVLVNDTGTVNATQWNQQNVDRLWVTVNGYRVPSSKLALNDYNELSILTEIASGDTVIITNMIPTSTPSKETYLNFVDNDGLASVYRITSMNSTYLTEEITPLTTEISVNDVNTLVNITEQNVNAPAPVNGIYTVGLDANKRTIVSVSVYNKTKMTTISELDYTLSLVDIAPALLITDGTYIDQNDELAITVVTGKTIYINGEMIIFNGVDFDNNKLLDIVRGVNGTAEQTLIANYSMVYGLLENYLLDETYYNKTWNSYVYNTVDGDPLQVSTTPAATFLNMG